MLTPSTTLQVTTATYVYAVCQGCDNALFADLPGQEPGGPVRVLRIGVLDAVAQDVSATDFSGDTLRERLSDPLRLGTYARKHHAVVARASATTPTVPLPLATLYHSDERARQALADEEGRLLATLHRLANRTEWGVKVYTRSRAARAEPSVSASSPGPYRPHTDAAQPGHVYLERLRGERHAREQRQQAGLKAAEAVERAMRDLAVAGRRLRSHGTQITGEKRRQLLNAAFLLPAGRDEEVARTIEQLRRSPDCQGVDIELTGPWAPYSFVDGNEGDDHR